MWQRERPRLGGRGPAARQRPAQGRRRVCDGGSVRYDVRSAWCPAAWCPCAERCHVARMGGIIPPFDPPSPGIGPRTYIPELLREGCERGLLRHRSSTNLMVGRSEGRMSEDDGRGCNANEAARKARRWLGARSCWAACCWDCRVLLNEWPRMLAPVIAERIGWPHCSPTSPAAIERGARSARRGR